MKLKLLKSVTVAVFTVCLGAVSARAETAKSPILTALRRFVFIYRELKAREGSGDKGGGAPEELPVDPEPEMQGWFGRA